MPQDRLQPRRSLLFVPAVRPDRYAKALAAGPDVVCVDLEDAVLPAEKDRARALALDLFAGRSEDRVERLLRVNSPRTPEGLKDLIAVIESRTPLDGLLLPKVATADEIRWVDQLVGRAAGDMSLHVLIESADGLANVQAIAGASPRLRTLAFGAVDLSAELGCENDFEALLYARSRVLHAAARNGLDAMDVPCLDIADEANLRAECARVRRMGFTGKLAIHPRQIGPINACFTPSPQEIARARQVIDAYDSAPAGLAVLDGKLVEIPVVKGMRRLLAMAEAAGVA